MTAAVLSIDRDLAEEILALLRRTQSRAPAMGARTFAADPALRARLKAELATEDAILGAAAATITTLWLNNAIGRAHAPLPQLANTDGEPLELVTLHYGLAPAASAEGIAAALARVPDLRDDGDGAHWTWLAPEKPSPKRRGRKGTDAPDTGRTIHGNLTLSAKILEARVNSEARCSRLRSLLAPGLAGLVSEPLIERMTPEQAMAEVGPATSSPQAIPEGMDAEDLRRITHEVTRCWIANIARPSTIRCRCWAAGDPVDYRFNAGINSAGEPAGGPAEAAAPVEAPKKRGRPKKAAAPPSRRRAGAAQDP